MRILIHGLNFAPEPVGVGKYTGEMAEWLAARGHEVRVVTAPPFNPEWKVASGFSPWRYTREERSVPSVEEENVRASATSVAASSGFATAAAVLTVELPKVIPEAGTGSLTVLRCPVWVPLRPSAMTRILHLATFALSSLPIMLRQISWKPEIVWVVEPTLFCVPAALLAGRFSRARTWLHIQDFEAAAGFEMGFLKSASLRCAVEATETKCMMAFDRVSTISEKMLDRLQERNIVAARLKSFPNWVDTSLIFPLAKPSPLRAELGIAPTDVVALYAGTMARKQGLDLLAEAARTMAARQDVRFVLCGEGPGKPALMELTAELGNVAWVPLQPVEHLNALLNLADIHLLPQRADAADLVMPSKLTGMLASGRPVVATALPHTQLARAVAERGIVVEPGNASAFAAAIGELASDPMRREVLGENARTYALGELEKQRVLVRFESDLLAMSAAS